MTAGKSLAKLFALLLIAGALAGCTSDEPGTGDDGHDEHADGENAGNTGAASNSTGTAGPSQTGETADECPGEEEAAEDEEDTNKDSGNPDPDPQPENPPGFRQAEEQDSTCTGEANEAGTTVERAVLLNGGGASGDVPYTVTFNGLVEAYAQSEQDSDGDGEPDQFPVDPGMFSWSLDFGAEGIDPAAGDETARNEEGAIQVEFTYETEGEFTAIFAVLFEDGEKLSASYVITTVTPLPPPAQTYYDLGPALGCTGDFVGNTCATFANGPGSPEIDGFWIALDESYWGWAMKSGVNKGPGMQEEEGEWPMGDTDCSWLDAGLTVLGGANGGGGPCAGVVPSGAAWLFYYSYATPQESGFVEFYLA